MLDIGRKKLAWWVRIWVIVKSGAPVTGGREFVMVTFAGVLSLNPVI